MLDRGPTGRVEKVQQTLTERREEEHVSKVEIEDNLFQRTITHHTKRRVQEEWVEETAVESPDF